MAPKSKTHGRLIGGTILEPPLIRHAHANAMSLCISDTLSATETRSPFSLLHTRREPSTKNGAAVV
jgi:hypothetical protein